MAGSFRPSTIVGGTWADSVRHSLIFLWPHNEHGVVLAGSGIGRALVGRELMAYEGQMNEKVYQRATRPSGPPLACFSAGARWQLPFGSRSIEEIGRTTSGRFNLPERVRMRRLPPVHPVCGRKTNRRLDGVVETR